MRIEHLQYENVIETNILHFLMFFKKVRGISNRDLAEKIHYKENYLTQVRNRSVSGGEKLLHALESFYLLDNLNQIQQIDREIEELKRQKAMLQEQTIEKFYAGRTVPAGDFRAGNVENQPSARAGHVALKEPAARAPVSFATAAAAVVAAVSQAADNSSKDSK